MPPYLFTYCKEGKQYILAKHPKISTKLHCLTSLKGVIFQDSKFDFFDPKHYVQDVTVMCTQYILLSCI